MIELLTNDEMAQADRLTIAAGTPGTELMEKAGAAVARAVLRRHPPGSRVAVIAGPGNNGGDGFVAARHLAAAGMRVRVSLIGARDRLRGDAAWAAAGWGGEVASSPDVSGAAVIIDALFGAGLDRPITGAALAAVEAMNGAGCPVVAVDLASGINGTTGAVMGAAVKASQSITFFRKKPGHLLLPGRIYCGPVSVADIGIKAATLAAINPTTFENEPGPVARPVSGAGHRRTQIRARACRRGLGRRLPHRGGAPCGDGGAARRGRPRHHRLAAGRARRQRDRRARGDGATGRRRRRARDDARRPPLQRGGDRSGRRRRRRHPGHGAGRARRRARRRHRRRRPHELRGGRGPRRALCGARRQRPRGAHPPCRRIPSAVRRRARRDPRIGRRIEDRSRPRRGTHDRAPSSSSRAPTP